MLRLHRYFKNDAVLQRGEPITVKGYSDAPVTCRLSGGNYLCERTVTPENGCFRALLDKTDDYISEYTLTVSTLEESVSISVTVGDVYVTAGQSNMSYCLGAVEERAEWRALAKGCKISLISLDEPPFTDISEVVRPVHEQDDFIRDYDWIAPTDDRIMGVSAISVQMATVLYRKTGVPIGVVHTAMGGLGVEAYLKRASLNDDGELMQFFIDWGRYQSEENYNNAGGRNYSQVAGVWNEKISPLKGLKFKGLVWYLGESSAMDYRNAVMFERSMRYIIRDVKKEFNNLPFVCVQITPEYYHYGERWGYMLVNEAILNLQNTVEGVYAIPSYDIEPRWLVPDGDLYYHPIHPTNKGPLSHRIANFLVDGKLCPQVEEVVKLDGKLHLKIKDGNGLRLGRVRGFTVAGADGKYYPAHATVIDQSTVEVYSPEVEAPELATYAFMQYQDFCDVKDVCDMPLFPYRSRQEKVTEGYCFTPAFMTEGATEVYENCFGWQAGTCRKHRVWRKGEIYDASNVEISVNWDEVNVSAIPDAEKYYMFGVSPSVCMSGHKHHLADFPYLSFSVKADAPCTLLGLVARLAGGDVIRFDLLNGSASAPEINISEDFTTVSINLKKGVNESYGPMEFDRALLESIVQVELSFRAKQEVTVTVKGLTFTSVNRSEKVAEAEKQALRADLNLPS